MLKVPKQDHFNKPFIVVEIKHHELNQPFFVEKNKHDCLNKHDCIQHART